MKPADLMRYVRDCESLRDDLSLLKSDVTQSSLIYYAVDYSEILAYVQPSLARGFFMFSDDAQDVSAELERAALQQVFFGGAAPLVVLPPYALELQSLTETLSAGATAEFAHAAAHASKELAALSKNRQFRRLQRVVVDDSTDQTALNEAVSFLENEAATVLLLLDQSYLHPIQRLKHLLKSRRITTLTLLAGRTVEPDFNIYTRWFERLSAVRPGRAETASRIDALAMAGIAAINATCEFKVVLVTRSQHMHEVAAEVGMRDCIRHPRSFVAFTHADEARVMLESRHADNDRDLTSRALGRLLDSLDAFLNAAKAVHKKTVRETEIDDTIAERLARIKIEWQSAARLRGAVPNPEPLGKERGARKRVHDVMTLAANNEHLRDAVRARLAHLSNEVAENHQLLGLLLQQRRSETLALPVLAPGASPISFPASHSMPYALEFYSERVVKWSTDFEAERRIRFEDLSEFFGATIDGARYEILLAVAYMFGVLNQWSVAETYCQLSLQYPDAIFGHEGRFLLAICMRKQKVSVERLLNAWDLIGVAERLKRRRLGSDDWEDPRFLKERATVIFVWNRLVRSGASSNPPPSISQAIDLCERVTTLPQSSAFLRAQAYNNLLYYYLEDDPTAPVADETLRRYFDNLEILCANLGPQGDSPWMRHTLALARWKKPFLRANQPLSDIAQELAVLASQQDLARDERREIRKHIEAIRSELRRQSLSRG